MSASDVPRSFNLVDEPWIPIAGAGEVSLWDVFAHPEYGRLGGTPVEKVVLLRLLLCIAHASCDVKTLEDWRALTPEVLSRNALAYLEKWKSRFDLFDEQYPFLQFPQLKGKCEESVPGAISLSVANGNKTLLTQWSINNLFSLTETSRLLLCGSGYGCGGGKYDLHAKVDPMGPEKRKKATGKASAPQGTLTGFYGYLHSFMLANTVLETVIWNMLTEQEIQALDLFSKANPMGRPFWESMPTDENGASAEKYRSSYQGTLFPMDKFFYLDGENLLMTQGITYPTHKAGQWDPGITLYGDLKDRKALWCDVEKKPWRQLPSLLSFFDTEKKNDTPAFLVLGNSRLIWKEVKNFGIWTGGVSVNSNSGEQYVSGKCDYLDSDFLIPMGWTTENSWLEYKGLMETLETFSRTLYGAVMGFHKSLMEDGSDKIAECAKRLFWEKMEPLAQSIVNLSEETDEAVVKAAVEQWKEIARSCYEWFCPHVTPRQIQAYAQNLPFFQTPQEKEQKKKEKKKKTPKKEKKNG